MLVNFGCVLRLMGYGYNDDVAHNVIIIFPLPVVIHKNLFDSMLQMSESVWKNYVERSYILFQWPLL